MKIDQQYLKDLLIAFEDSEGPDTTLEEIKNAGFETESSAFIFHMRLVHDNGLICKTNGESNLGQIFTRTDEGASYFWDEIPWRLSAKGHDFIADLRQKEVWEQVKTGFKDASISTLISVSRELAEGYAKKKISGILGQ